MSLTSVNICFWQIESGVQLLRGHILEALENRSMAVECYREALKLDVHCYEALDCLIQHHMLTALEGSKFSHFQPIFNLNNISKILEMLFLTRLQPCIISSPNFNPLQSAWK